MTFDIKTIEDLSLNAWPSHQMQVYDGWILRFSYFYTHRTNSVEQIGPSILPFSEKVPYCEQIYQRWGTPSIFKITPLCDPCLESLLIKRDYHIEHSTDVMVLNLCDLPESFEPYTAPVELENCISDFWIRGLFDLKGTDNPIHRRIVPSMYAAIPKDVISVCIRDQGRIVATGLGILDRDYIGIYAIHVEEAYRGQHFATQIVQTLLEHGRRQGASRAYLQVVSGNQPAIALYRKIGFRRFYTYWFRVKDILR